MIVDDYQREQAMERALLSKEKPVTSDNYIVTLFHPHTCTTVAERRKLRAEQRRKVDDKYKRKAAKGKASATAAETEAEVEERTTPPQHAQPAGDQPAGEKAGAASGADCTGTATTVRANLLAHSQSRTQLCTASFISIPSIPLSRHSLADSISQEEPDDHNGASAASSASAKAPGGE
eukprot:6197481-Pleurochrysis_carterae.AAC.2